MSTTPETAASLHGRRASLETKLRDQLLAGGATQRTREDLAAVDRQLAERAHADALAWEERQAKADALIQAAAQEAANNIRQRLDAVLEDLEPPEWETAPMDDAAIAGAAADLAAADSNLAAANAAFADAQARSVALGERITTLETRRAGIIERRQAGDQRAGDGAELALIAADLEGLAAMKPAAAEPLITARQAVTEATTARQRAVTALSTAEDVSLAAALHERLDQLAWLMGAALAKDDARLKRMRHFRPDWIAPPQLLTALQLRAASRPDLATAGLPGSRFPARQQPLVDA